MGLGHHADRARLVGDLAEKVQKIKPAEKFKFGEWLPDQADLDNPGITEANNVLWTAGSYIPYNPFIPTGFKVPGGTPLISIRGQAGSSILYVASTDGVSNNYLSAAAGNSFNLVNLTGPTLAYASSPSFAQYGNTIFYADGVNNPQYNGLNLASQFAKLTGPQGDAPIARCVGVLGQFVLLGGLQGNPTTLQWSSINQPFNWPTPGSANAIASQAGSQFLDYTLGPILGVAQGDQWGLVMCVNGIVRVQYVGGDVVFQFDTIYRGPSTFGPQSWCKVGGRIYSCGGDGFIVTDGVSVRRIGNSKIDRWFQSRVNPQGIQIGTGVDPLNKVIYWTFPLNGTGIVQNAWVAYNYLEERWTHGTDGIACYVRAEDNWEYVPGYGMEAFSSASAPQGGGYGGTLSGTPITATLTTAEIELNPGGRALLQGFRPQIAGLDGGSMTVRIGSRSRLGDQVAYTPALPLNGQTNFADALVDANYHRAEVTINGNFNQAIGGEFKAEPTGDW